MATSQNRQRIYGAARSLQGRSLAPTAGAKGAGDMRTFGGHNLGFRQLIGAVHVGLEESELDAGEIALIFAQLGLELLFAAARDRLQHVQGNLPDGLGRVFVHCLSN